MNDHAKAAERCPGEIRMVTSYARRVWALIPARQKLTLAVGGLLMAIVSACSTAFALLLGNLLDRVKFAADHGETAQTLYHIAGTFLALISVVFLVREVVQVARRYLIENTCTQIEKRMTVELFSHMMKASLTTLSQEKIGALHGRVSRCVVQFVRFIRLTFLDFLPPLLTGVFALIAAVAKQPLLALVMTGVVPASLYLTLRQLRSQKGIRLALIRSREELDGTVVEQLGGLEYIRAANTHDYEVKRIEEAAERQRQMEIRHHLKMSLYGSFKALNEAFFHILVLALAAYLAIEGRISYGDILTFSFLFANVMAPLNEVHRGLDEGHECTLTIAELLKMLEEPIDPSFAPADAREPVAVPGEPILVSENVASEYPTEIGSKCALKGVSTVIRHGETIGLAGPSGCGKTTWLRVLLRLTHPSAGRVTIGGVPLESVSRDAIGKLVGYVGQAPYVFAGTIADNIRYGNPHASLNAVEEAARRACLHEEIVEIPGGYEAPVRERGLNLSAGQRQRLALARVFLKDPPILILDEGTSALDTISEHNIQRAIDLARKDRTVILVAHRVSTLVDADRIYVFQEGQITEAGSFTELYRRGGVFTALVDCAGTGVATGGGRLPSVS
jgi:ATP-binding cassette subfamily B protein